jgi:hypothetical protein
MLANYNRCPSKEIFEEIIYDFGYSYVFPTGGVSFTYMKGTYINIIIPD